MKTLFLTVDDKAYPSLIEFINTINGVEVADVLTEEFLRFQKQKQYLESELEKIQKGELDLVELDEFEDRLNKIIQKNEVKTV